MFRCFHWHNLRYIKKPCRALWCLMPILLSSSGGSCMLIIGGSRVHAHTHMHRDRTHTWKYSLHAFFGQIRQRQSNGADLIELRWHRSTVTLSGRRWLTWASAGGSIGSTGARLCFKFMFDFILQRQISSLSHIFGLLIIIFYDTTYYESHPVCWS